MKQIVADPPRELIHFDRIPPPLENCWYIGHVFRSTPRGSVGPNRVEIIPSVRGGLSNFTFNWILGSSVRRTDFEYEFFPANFSSAIIRRVYPSGCYQASPSLILSLVGFSLTFFFFFFFSSKFTEKIHSNNSRDKFIQKNAQFRFINVNYL